MKISTITEKIIKRLKYAIRKIAENAAILKGVSIGHDSVIDKLYSISQD